MGELIPFKIPAGKKAIIKQRKETDDLIRERLEKTLDLYSTAMTEIQDILLSLPANNSATSHEGRSLDDFHLIYDSRLDVWGCPICDFASTTARKVHNHMDKQHPEWSAGRKKTQEEHFQRLRTEHPEQYTEDHKCPQCDKAFHRKSSLACHVYQKHTKQQKGESGAKDRSQ